jgi:hypothetical protein
MPNILGSYRFLVIGKVIKHYDESVTGSNYKAEDKWP